ncbi:MAG: tRNA (adenine-N1)-methyltransferase [Desulfobacterales bacterium]
MIQSLPSAIVVTDNKKFRRVVRTRGTDSVNLPSGSISMADISEIGLGGMFFLNGKKYYVLECDTHDLVMKGIKRDTQIIYPKDAGYILLRLDVFPGKKVGEAGTGSGGLTLIMAKAVGQSGRVYTYEKNASLADRIRKNLRPAEDFENVRLYTGAAEEGIHETGLDAFFLDVRDPAEALGSVYAALKPGGHLGVLVPTANQMSRLLWALRDYPFMITEAAETFLRTYKTNPSRFRPEDRMVGHTGYLLFARALQKNTGTDTENAGK